MAFPHQEGAELTQQWQWIYPDSLTLSGPFALVANGTEVKGGSPSLWCRTKVKNVKLRLVHLSQIQVQNVVKATLQYNLEL